MLSSPRRGRLASHFLGFSAACFLQIVNDVSSTPILRILGNNPIEISTVQADLGQLAVHPSYVGQQAHSGHNLGQTPNDAVLQELHQEVAAEQQTFASQERNFPTEQKAF